MTLYPLVLTPEELFCLRLMLRTTVSRRLLEAASELRQRVESPPEGLTPVMVDALFANKVIALTDHLRNLDTPLFHAGIIHPNQTVVVNLVPEAFNTLKAVANFDYLPDPGDDATKALTERIRASQGTIQSALLHAEEQAQAKVAPTQPMPPGVN